MKRRNFVKTSALSAVSISAFGAIHWNGKNFEGDTVTTTDILGPFYRPGSPMRNDLVPPGSQGEILHLKGTLFKADGKTPLSGALIESWQCDENEVYDNTSDDYILRGAVISDKNGQYEFRTIVPVPYNTGSSWRPAHIHLRISSKDHQDLITQIYFKGDPHLQEDSSAASPLSANRILEIKKNANQEKVVTFDVVLGKSQVLEDAAYKKIAGLYQLEKGMAEFYRQDDLLFLKWNGQIMEGMAYKGNNTFEGGLGFSQVKFDLHSQDQVTASITMMYNGSEKPPQVYEGKKILKYGG